MDHSLKNHSQNSRTIGRSYKIIRKKFIKRRKNEEMLKLCTLALHQENIANINNIFDFLTEKINNN